MHNLFSIVKCRFIICLKANHKIALDWARVRSNVSFRFISFARLDLLVEKWILASCVFLFFTVMFANEQWRNTRWKIKDMDQCSVFLFACYSQCFLLLFQKGCISLIEMVRWFSFVIVPSESPARFDSVETLERGRYLIPSPPLFLSLGRCSEVEIMWNEMKWRGRKTNETNATLPVWYWFFSIVRVPCKAI